MSLNVTYDVTYQNKIMLFKICYLKYLNNGQNPIDIRPVTRYNVFNLIRKKCYHYCIKKQMVATDMKKSLERNGYTLRVTVSSFCQRKPFNFNDFKFSYFDTD